MYEFGGLLKIVADGMTSLAKGIDELADRIGSLSLSNRVEPEEPIAPLQVVVRRRPGRRVLEEDTAGATVLNLIGKSRMGIDIYTLKQETGFDDRKIYNIIYRLNKQGKIKNLRKGVYVKA